MLDRKKVTDNKTFQKTIKLFLSDKTVSTETIILITNGEVVPTEQDTAQVLNTFFFTVVTNLKIPEYTEYDPVSNNVSDLNLKLIVRSKNHPNILTKVRNKSQKCSFSFFTSRKKRCIRVDTETGHKKAATESDIRPELLKEIQTYSVTLCL